MNLFTSDVRNVFCVTILYKYHAETILKNHEDHFWFKTERTKCFTINSLNSRYISMNLKWIFHQFYNTLGVQGTVSIIAQYEHIVSLSLYPFFFSLSFSLSLSLSLSCLTKASASHGALFYLFLSLSLYIYIYVSFLTRLFIYPCLTQASAA